MKQLGTYLILLILAGLTTAGLVAFVMATKPATQDVGSAAVVKVAVTKPPEISQNIPSQEQVADVPNAPPTTDTAPEGRNPRGLVPLTPACIAFVADHYHFPVAVLEGLRAAEGGAVGMATPNHAADGHITSYDFGPFQVNDRWIAKLTKSWRRASPDETKELLLNNGCANALAAGEIFRTYLDQAGGNYGIAVGWYHSHDPARAETYRQQFLATFYQKAKVDKSNRRNAHASVAMHNPSILQESSNEKIALIRFPTD